MERSAATKQSCFSPLIKNEIASSGYALLAMTRWGVFVLRQEPQPAGVAYGHCTLAMHGLEANIDAPLGDVAKLFRWAKQNSRVDQAFGGERRFLILTAMIPE
jgi:hypothetical protein